MDRALSILKYFSMFCLGVLVGEFLFVVVFPQVKYAPAEIYDFQFQQIEPTHREYIFFKNLLKQQHNIDAKNLQIFEIELKNKVKYDNVFLKGAPIINEVGVFESSRTNNLYVGKWER